MAYTNDDIYRLINFTIRKDTKGQPMTLENFSLLLDTKGQEYYEVIYDRYEQSSEMSDSLRRFKVTKSGAQLTFTGTSNQIDLPTNYAHKGFLYHKKGGTDIKPVEQVSDDGFMMRQDAEIEAPSVDYPIARMITDYLEYLPATLDQNNFTFSYLRYPLTPFYDYYIDANGVTTYLAVAEGHNWSDGETDSSGVVHSSASSSVSGYEYTSLTVNLDFEEEDQIKIAYKILQTLSITIDEGGVFQYAEQIKTES